MNADNSHVDGAQGSKSAQFAARRHFLRTASLSAAALVTGGLTSPARLIAADPSEVTIKLGDDTADFLAGKDLVGRYQFGKTWSKPFLFPLNAPGNVAITRAWPIDKGVDGESADHPHQKSAWFTHGDVIPEGLDLKDKIKGVKGVDFWSEAPGHGKIVCTEVGKPKADKNHAALATKNEWRTADGVKIMDEDRTVQLYDLGDARLFVFDIDLHASAMPITFGDTKEGSFGVRVKDVIREDKVGKGKLETSEGKVGEKNLWGSQAGWCDYSGPIGDKVVGVAVFDDPTNSAKACWHSRGYGLMAANPFGRGGSGFPAMKGKTDLVKLAKGDHLKLRYGILLHSGDAKEGKVAEHYEKFAKLGK